MSSMPLTPTVPPGVRSSTFDHLKDDPAYQGYLLLRIGFAVAPILFGADKFANVMVNWEKYLAPWLAHLSPLSATHTMHVVGVVDLRIGRLERPLRERDDRVRSAERELLHQRRDRSTPRCLGDEIVAVEVVAFDGDEERAGLHPPGA